MHQVTYTATDTANTLTGVGRLMDDWASYLAEIRGQVVALEKNDGVGRCVSGVVATLRRFGPWFLRGFLVSAPRL